jgi:DICT domain-containing protein
MPDVMIDPDLSVYGLMQRIRTQRPVRRHRKTMLIISHEIENATIKAGAHARVFAGFQRMSNFVPQEARYRHLKEKAESVYVFGVMDVEPPLIANVHYIPIQETDQLAKEWFVIADAPDYFSALASEAIAGPAEGLPSFQGVWSFDEGLVTALQEGLTSVVDANPLGDLSEGRDRRRHVAILTNSLFRLSSRLVGTIGNFTPETMITAKELSAVVQDELGPAVQTMANRLKAEQPPTSTDNAAPAV